jgi:hypothetical protein
MTMTTIQANQSKTNFAGFPPAPSEAHPRATMSLAFTIDIGVT